MKCLPTYKGKSYNSIDLIKNIIKGELAVELETGVKREDQVSPEVNLTLSQKAHVADNIAQVVMKKIGMSDSLTSTELERLLDETFEEIVRDNQENFPGYVNELMFMKDEILGVRRFFNEDTSARGYISTYLGLEEKVTQEDTTEEAVGEEDSAVEGSDSPAENTDPDEVGQDFESTSSYGWDQRAYEIDMTKSLSKKVMMLLSGVKSRDKYGKTSLFESFMALDSFVEPSTVLLALQDILANSSNDLDSMRAKIEAKIEESPLFGFLQEVMDRIDAQPTLVQNQILNKLNSVTNDMKFVLVKVNLNTGKIHSGVLDANSRAPEVKLAREFQTNFKQSPLINMEDEKKFTLNVAEAEKALEVLEDLSNQAETSRDTVDPNAVSEALRKFGLNIHPYTIEGYLNRPDSTLDLSYRYLYSKSVGPIGAIMRNLENAIRATKEMNSQNEKLYIPLDYTEGIEVEMNSGETLSIGQLAFFDNSNFMKELIKAELKNRLPEDSSIYEDGKPIYNKNIPNLAKSLKNEIRQALLAYHQSPSKETQGKLEELLGQSINKNNFMLQAMMENVKAAIDFDVETISPSSFKVRESSGDYRKNDRNGKLSDLGPKDYLTVMQGFFGQMGTGIALGEDTENSKSARMASMFFPTLSDASDLYILRGVVRDITNEEVKVNAFTNQVALSESILSYMSENLVYNELNRISGYMMNMYLNNKFDGINSDQNFSSMFLLGVPGLNTMRGEDGTMVIDSIHAAIKVFADEVRVKGSTANKMSETEQMEELDSRLRSFLKNPVDNFMTNLAQKEKEKFLKKDLETEQYTGEWVSKDLVSSTSTGLKNNVIDTKFLESKAKSRPIEERLEVAALDFAINSLVSQANIQNVFAGDLTNYAKEAGSFEKDANGDTDFFALESPLIPEDTEAREEAMKAVIQAMNKKLSDNRSKRLKALLSPSLKNANSKGKEYLQVFLQDVESVSDYIESLVNLHYPGEINQEERDLISKTLRAQKELEAAESAVTPDENIVRELKDQIKFGRKFISTRFPKVKGFTEITGTDAQEYTTWREHLRTLVDRGMIEGNYSVEEVKKIYQKLNDYEKSDYKGALDLTEKEKEIIFQPLKPLHAGTYSDNGSVDNPYKYGFVNSQFVYVKTSSFPLIPGVTAGTQLDNIRQNLENLEKMSGMPVRASYASGNKVGGTKIAVNTNTLSANILTDNQLANFQKVSTRKLKREYFGIQQDKAYKADKNLEAGKRNEISRAVQIERALLSNGIATDSKKMFDLNELDRDFLASIGVEVSADNKISGQDLFTIINELYSEEQDLNREILYNKFNATGQEWQNDVKTIEKLRGILIREAKTSQAKKALDLVYLVQEEVNGENIQREVTKAELDKNNLKAVSARFKVPVWLNNNSLSTESSLNAMVSKSLARLKMSGWSSPVASSNKFKLKEQSDLTEKDISDIVYLDSYEGGELQYDVDENGKLKYAQVLVSSRFEYNKEVGTDADGNPTYKKAYADLTSKEYSEIQGGRRVLKKENFDKDLLKALSFRTPYSDLGSGATIEIVGFLPRKMGDLMVVPKEHTVQFGEDYDIDVRNVYSFNLESYKTESGTVGFRKLSPKKNTAFLKKNFKKIQEEYEAEREIILGQAEDLQGEYYMLNMDRVAEIQLLRERKNVLKPLVKSGEITEQELIDELDLINTTLAELDSEVAKTQYRENVAEINSMVSQALAEIGRSASEKRTKALSNVTQMRAYQQHRKKMIENDILKVYHAVYGSNDKEIRRSINKSLNTDLSEDTVKIMKDSSVDTRDTTYDTMYSSLEQQKIMESGHSGKLGIGVHSLWVTFTALAQHMEKPISVNFGENNSQIQFGNLVFNPTIGSKNTVSNQKEGIYKNVLRLITEVNMENQNVATDNQKLLVMGDRNENEFTINAFALLCNMGVDTDTLVHPDHAIKDSKGKITGYKQVHVPSLFLNQPILKRYVELKKQNNSLTNGNFMSDKDIYNKLFDELAENSSKEAVKSYRDGVVETEGEGGVKSSEPISLDFSNLTPENLLSQATGGEQNPIEQAQILHFFRELDIKAKEVSAHQGVLKVGSNGIDRSSFKNIQVKQFLKNLGSGKEGSLEGITGMYGEFLEIPVQAGETIQEAMNQASKAVPAGFVLGEDFSEDNGTVIRVFVPNNFAGAKLASVVQATTDILGNIFPYENPAVQDLIRTVFGDTELYRRSMANKDSFGPIDMFSGKGLEFTYKIMAGLKSYLGTAEFSGFFQESVPEERRRILYKERLVDTNTGEEVTLPSLPGYLNQLRTDPEYEWLFKQAFFRSIDPILNDLNTPDILRLHLNNKNATEMQNINTFLRSLYENSDKKLPDFKGDKDYNTKKLVTDLARYASLAGDSGGAMGFKNLIPFEVFEDSRYNEVLRMFDNIMTSGGESRFDSTISLAAQGNMNAMMNLVGPSKLSRAMRESEGGASINLEDLSEETLKRVSNLAAKLNKANNREVFSLSGKILTVVNLSDSSLIRNVLKDQVLRHNPDMLVSVTENKILDAAEDFTYIEGKEEDGIWGVSRMTLPDTALGALKLGKDTEYFKVPYGGGVSIFRKVPGTDEFIQVDKLGMVGSQEYTFSNSHIESGIGSNTSWKRDTKLEESVNEEGSDEVPSGSLENPDSTVEDTLNNSQDLPKTVFELAQNDPTSSVILREMSDGGLFNEGLGPIEFVDSLVTPTGSTAGGVYISAGKTFKVGDTVHTGPKVLLNREIFNDPEISLEEKARVLAEELIHKATVEFTREFVATSVEIDSKNPDKINLVVDERMPMPKSLKDLIDIKQAALNIMVRETAKNRGISQSEAVALVSNLINSYNDSQLATSLGDLSLEDQRLKSALYSFINLEEFIAGLVSNKGFRTLMSKHSFQGVKILEKFAKILEEMFNTISKFSGRDATITEAGSQAILELILDIRKENPSVKAEENKNNQEDKKIINEADDGETTLLTFNTFAEEDRSFLTERFLTELNQTPFTRAMAKALEKVTKKC